MALAESGSRARRWLGWSLVALIALTYVALPAVEERGTADETLDERDELDRPEILRVSPSEPYPGASLRVEYAGLPTGEPPSVFANGRLLPRLAARDGEVVVRLARDFAPGDLRVKLALGTALEQQPRSARSKAYHVRVKAVNPRKVMRGLLGGAALVLLGVRAMARGVRQATGLGVARSVARAARVRSLAYALGALLGALVQSTTSAAAVLAALSSAGVLSLAPAALALLGAAWGAALAPLAASGFMESREGLLAIALGVAWLALSVDRQAAARARLVLGIGLLGFGLSLVGSALEPVVSSPSMLAMLDELRVRGPLDVLPLCLLGAALVALLHGPAALVVLLLAMARGGGQWDLASALALLSGTGLGVALAALLTASAGSEARRLARLHLALGALGSLGCALLAIPVAHACELLWAALGAPLHPAFDAPRSLAMPLALGFTVSQVSLASLLTVALGPLLARRRAGSIVAPGEPAQALAHVLDVQHDALVALSELARRGARGAGQRAEHALAESRAALAGLVHDELAARAEAAHAGAPLACLSLQHALESLLAHAEAGTDVRLRATGEPEAARWERSPVLGQIHALVTEGLAATRHSLRSGEPPDLEQARAREIQINRLEAQARAASSAQVAATTELEQQLSLLRVVDAYEVVGNHVYRLTEAMEDAHAALLAP